MTYSPAHSAHIGYSCLHFSLSSIVAFSALAISSTPSSPLYTVYCILSIQFSSLLCMYSSVYSALCRVCFLPHPILWILKHTVAMHYECLPLYQVTAQRVTLFPRVLMLMLCYAALLAVFLGSVSVEESGSLSQASPGSMNLCWMLPCFDPSPLEISTVASSTSAYHPPPQTALPLKPPHPSPPCPPPHLPISSLPLPPGLLAALSLSLSLLSEPRG